MAATFDISALASGLPFLSALDDLHRAVTPSSVAVVQAPPGTGKTTVVPPAMAELFPNGRVVVTQPRRIAARSAARRLAALSGATLGDLVGYTVRGERRASAATRVEFVTPGVLVRRLIADPDLPGVSAVVLDEVHERHLESDVALAFLAELRQLRDDFPVVAMSATVDAPRFANLLGSGESPAPVVSMAATLHPLAVHYRPPATPRMDAKGVRAEFLTHIAEVAAEEQSATGHDALVFVPGAREIDRVVSTLHARLGQRVEVCALHGSMSAAEQDRAISIRTEGAPPRIVVSTDLAESSLTVPGVRLVVDSCLSREPRVDTGRGMTGLVTVSASRDACTQRAGRAARLGPGRVVRCVAEADFARAPEHRTPAIATSDLTAFALDVACWGAPRATDLPLLDPPPAATLERAEAVLRDIGAVDERGAATTVGRQLAGLPVDPRLARALLEGAPVVGRRLAAEVVAAIAGGRAAPGVDLAEHLRALRSGRTDASRVWARERERLLNLLPPDCAAQTTGDVADQWAAGFVVALAYPQQVACVRGQQYTLASGTGAVLPPHSGLDGQRWLAVAQATRSTSATAGGAGAVIGMAAAIDRDTAERAAGHLRTDRVQAELSGGRVTARQVSALGGIELHSTPIAPDIDAVRSVLAAALRSDGLSALHPDDDAESLYRRMALVYRVFGDPWPSLSGPDLAERIDEWLAPELSTLTGGATLASLDTSTALNRLMPWTHPEVSRRFDDLVPPRLRVPSGSSYQVSYPPAGSDQHPILAVKLQECFGWQRCPAVCDGKVPVAVHLLSPAGRPLAISQDLEFFWTQVYPQVRAEMRGRYPKHPWPVDPLTATATRSTTTKR